MRFCELRIVWSVVWGVPGVLVLLLWVRSYWWGDYWGRPHVEVSSMNGSIGYQILQSPYSFQRDSYYECRSVKEIFRNWGPPSTRGDDAKRRLVTFRWDYFSYPACIPHWAVCLPCLLLAIVPWVRQLNWRFSLRTMLIVTALVATGLGAIVWAVK